MRAAAISLALATALLLGCRTETEYVYSPDYIDGPMAPTLQPAAPAQANPVFIPIADPHCAWETVVDVVDDYFRIEREEPVRMLGNTPTEGVLVTFPEVSPTLFEPWRHDTVDPRQRVENTLQSMRRRAVLRVTPAQGGHWVEVTVFKELEDVKRPEHASAGAATFRYDSSLSGVVDPLPDQQTSKGWIPQGRDASLEQHIIGHLLDRSAPKPPAEPPPERWWLFSSRPAPRG
jgi:hypothetical protein